MTLEKFTREIIDRITDYVLMHIGRMECLPYTREDYQGGLQLSLPVNDKQQKTFIQILLNEKNEYEIEVSWLNYNGILEFTDPEYNIDIDNLSNLLLNIYDNVENERNWKECAKGICQAV